MMVCVRVSFMSGPKPSAIQKSALQTNRKPRSGSPLRLVKLAKGGEAAQKEAHRMVAEKIAAAQAAALKLAMGGTAGSVMSDYRKKVRANRARLRGR
jgi:hypothetical protein